jgi:hypothetical protein
MSAVIRVEVDIAFQPAEQVAGGAHHMTQPMQLKRIDADILLLSEHVREFGLIEERMCVLRGTAVESALGFWVRHFPFVNSTIQLQKVVDLEVFAIFGLLLKEDGLAETVGRFLPSSNAQYPMILLVPPVISERPLHTVCHWIKLRAMRAFNHFNGWNPPNLTELSHRRENKICTPSQLMLLYEEVAVVRQDVDLVDDSEVIVKLVRFDRKSLAFTYHKVVLWIDLEDWPFGDTKQGVGSECGIWHCDGSNVRGGFLEIDWD